MKKITMVAGVVVLAGVGYAGASWYVGQQAETQIRQSVIQANDGFLKTFGRGLDGSGATLVLKDYQRGWFSSDAVYQLTIKQEDNEKVDVSFSDHLQHGPFPLVLLKAGDFTPMLAYSQSKLMPMPAIKPWFDAQKEIAPVYATTQIGFGGKGQSVITFAPVEHADAEGKLNFSGGAITIDFTNNFQESVSSGTFDSLKYVSEEDDESFELNGLTINNKTSKVDQRITTESQATIAKLIVNDEQEVRLEQLQANLNSVQQDSMLQGSVIYDAKKAFVDGLDLGSLKLTASVDKLDITALSDLVETYEEIDKQNGGSDLSDEQEALLQKKILVILATKPEVSIAPLTWSNAAGTSSAGVSVSLVQPKDLAKIEEDPFGSLTEVLEKLKLDVKLSRPMLINALKSIAEHSEEPIDEAEAAIALDEYFGNFEKMGLVKVDKDGATLNMLYQNGEIVLNGEKMSLENFMMLVMLLAM